MALFFAKFQFGLDESEWDHVLSFIFLWQKHNFLIHLSGTRKANLTVCKVYIYYQQWLQKMLIKIKPNKLVTFHLITNFEESLKMFVKLANMLLMSLNTNSNIICLKRPILGSSMKYTWTCHNQDWTTKNIKLECAILAFSFFAIGLLSRLIFSNSIQFSYPRLTVALSCFFL